MITLDEKTVDFFKELYDQIEVEMNKPCLEYDVDLVTKNQIKILDTLESLIRKEVAQ